MDRGAWWVTVHGVARVRHDLATKLPPPRQWEMQLWHRDFQCSLIASIAAAAKSLQSCPTLCDPIDDSPPGSSVHGIFQARVLEWGAVAFSGIHCWGVAIAFSLSKLGYLWP